VALFAAGIVYMVRTRRKEEDVQDDAPQVVHAQDVSKPEFDTSGASDSENTEMHSEEPMKGWQLSEMERHLNRKQWTVGPDKARALLGSQTNQNGENRDSSARIRAEWKQERRRASDSAPGHDVICSAP
jgi:hypothetical protein